MTSDAGTLSHSAHPQYPFPSSIVVGDGSLLPIAATSVAHFSSSLSLNNVLVSPKLIKNLIYVHQFTSDNNCSIEFDPAGYSMKDLASRRLIVRCNSSDTMKGIEIVWNSRLIRVYKVYKYIGSPWERFIEIEPIKG